METNTNSNKRTNLKKAGFIIASLLIVLIFFSNTAYSFNQPVITATKPTNGKLKKNETTSGITDWADKKEIYAQLSGTVSEVFVKEGDTVKEGQELFRITYDKDTILKNIKENNIAKKKTLLDIESIKLKLQKVNENIKTLEEETYKQESTSTYEIEELKRQITNLESEYDKTAVLYEAGAVPKSDLDKAGYELETAKKKLADQMDQHEEAKNKSLEDLDEKK